MISGVSSSPCRKESSELAGEFAAGAQGLTGTGRLQSPGHRSQSANSVTVSRAPEADLFWEASKLDHRPTDVQWP